MSDTEKIEWLENKIVEDDLFDECQLDAIEKLLWWLGDCGNKTVKEENELQAEALEMLYSEISGFNPDYDEDEEEIE